MYLLIEKGGEKEEGEEEEEKREVVGVSALIFLR